MSDEMEKLRAENERLRAEVERLCEEAQVAAGVDCGTALEIDERRARIERMLYACEKASAEIERLQRCYDTGRAENERLHERLAHHRGMSLRIVAGFAICGAILFGLILINNAFEG